MHFLLKILEKQSCVITIRKSEGAVIASNCWCRSNLVIHENFTVFNFIFEIFNVVCSYQCLVEIIEKKRKSVFLAFCVRLCTVDFCNQSEKRFFKLRKNSKCSFLGQFSMSNFCFITCQIPYTIHQLLRKGYCKIPLHKLW